MEWTHSVKEELAAEARHLEQQISTNVIPDAEVVEKQVGVKDIIVARDSSVDQDYYFFVDTTVKQESAANSPVRIRTMQTLGVFTDEPTDLLQFTCEEKFPSPFEIDKEYSVEADTLLKVVSMDVLNDHNFDRYRRLVELAGHIAVETMDPEAVSKEDHLLDMVYGDAHAALKDKQPDFTNYRHLISGLNMGQVHSVYKLNGDIWRKVSFDKMPTENYPIISTDQHGTKIVRPKDPIKALSAIKEANKLLLDSLIFPY